MGKSLRLQWLVVLLCLVSMTNAQGFVSLLSGNADDNDTLSDAGESPDDESFFTRILSGRSDREKEAYSNQRSRFFGNKTLNNILVRLRDTEEVEEEDHSLFAPFFQWADDEKQSKYEKLKELKEKGKEKMAEKMAKWNMTGLFQRYYGAETGVSILEVDPENMDFMTAWTTMLEDEDVEFAELDMDVELFQDCRLTSNWGYEHTRADTAVEELGLMSVGSESDTRVLVAVIDSGINYEHPLLRDRIWINEAEYNGIEGVDDDGNGLVDDIWGWNFAANSNDVNDEDGHGTHVAGIIAAEASADPLFSGVAPNVMILPCRFTDAASGSADSGSVSAAIQCIEYAFEMGVDMISNSWGGAGAYSLALEQAMRRASLSGRLQINAAGNAAVDNDGSIETATFPASFDTDIIISVAAINGDGSLSEISNFGAVSTDIGAPGVSVFSTQLDGDFVRMSGTSQATPFVTAGAALLMGACREQQQPCSALDIKNALLQGAAPDPSLQGRVVSSGFLDIPNAARILGLSNSTERDSAPDICSSVAPLPSWTLIIIFVILVSVFLN